MKSITLSEYVEAHGQENIAKALNINQSAVAKALKKKRNITITCFPDGSIEAEEVRPFPSQRKKAA